MRLKLSRNRDTKIKAKQVLAGLKIIQLMKNWPVYFKDFFGMYKDGFLTYKFRNGVKLFIKAGSFERNMVNETWIYKEYTPKGFEIRKNDIVMDIGANSGIFTIYAASKASEGKVYAFEPVKENFKRLKKNIELNRFSNISAYNVGVSDKTGTRTIMVSNVNSGGHSFYISGDDKKDKFSVDTISLTDIFKKNKIKRINFLKCDCEGAEYEILFPAKELLKRVDKISMEVHYLNERKNVFTMKNFLEENGFKVKIFPEYENGSNMLYASRISPQ